MPRYYRESRASKDTKRQKWMAQYEQEAKRLGASPVDFDWNTAHFFFNEGVGPLDAARRKYGRSE